GPALPDLRGRPAIRGGSDPTERVTPVVFSRDLIHPHQRERVDLPLVATLPPLAGAVGQVAHRVPSAGDLAGRDTETVTPAHHGGERRPQRLADPLGEGVDRLLVAGVNVVL